jgi:lycopene beta-cyclase
VKSTYDYCIIGAGAAGLQLAMAFAKDPYFSNKEILLIDKSQKGENDRTWCFWEKGKGQWDDILDHSWRDGKFMYNDVELDLILDPYLYKKLKGISFYEYGKTVIGKAENVTWITSEVIEVITEVNRARIVTPKANISAEHCFDSRVDIGFENTDDKYTRILQHFKGWTIEFEKDVFDPESFTMMDFRILHNEGTTFTYVLPVSSRQALVEFTLFTPDLLDQSEYDPYLKEYVKTYISKEQYQIKDVEYGIIPMTDYPFHRASTKTVTKIGTAGSWVRPSSGYSFKNAEKNVATIVANIKGGRIPCAGILKSKFRFYDALLLKILDKHNHLGPGIFYQMYSRSPVQRIFRFLDGESTLKEDYQIISSLKPWPFLRALISYLLPFRL